MNGMGCQIINEQRLEVLGIESYQMQYQSIYYDAVLASFTNRRMGFPSRNYKNLKGFEQQHNLIM